jgi:hypothetical protein
VKIELVEETGSLEMMVKGWKRRSSRIAGPVVLEGYKAQYMLSEMRPKEIAEPVYAFSLPGRGLPFRVDWMCRLLET